MVEVPLPSPRRCAARRMATFPAAPLLLALEALAATSKGLPAPPLPHRAITTFLAHPSLVLTPLSSSVVSG